MYICSCVYIYIYIYICQFSASIRTTSSRGSQILYTDAVSSHGKSIICLRKCTHAIMHSSRVWKNKQPWTFKNMYYTILYYITLYYTTLHHTIPHHTIPFHSIP